MSFKVVKLLNTNIINEKIYKLGTGKILNFTSQPLQERLEPIRNIILKNFLNYINT